ncbi:MAG: TerC/Alx family metal homeostasis membrane protein [Bacteroidetes bacterium]|nr:TerC/Alx family metal homeostasis membrane protein [Bacteroidota bacterium]
MGSSEMMVFGVFLLVVLALLFVDLGIFTRRSHKVGFREAIIWTAVWVSMAMGFYFFLMEKGEMLHAVKNSAQLSYLINEYGHSFLTSGIWAEDLIAYRENLGLEFLTGYLIEYALSIDNIFVMIVIFSAFNVREKYYKTILFWGVLGAIVMRFLFIFIGASLLEHFHWVMYAFGGILLYTGIKMIFAGDEEDEIDANNHPVVKYLSKVVRIFPRNVGSHFIIKKGNKRYLTPLLVALVVIEFSDVVFAFDSVPAIFSVTEDPYIVFFSNVFAIMGLRSLFFLLTNIMHLFHYLKFGLGILMLFIGLKMMFHSWMLGHGFTTEHSLYIILGILALSILSSIIFPEPKEDDSGPEQ